TKMLRHQLKLVILLVLAALAMAQLYEQARELENNKITVELPTVNLTRLYNALSLNPIYTKLFNTSKSPLTTALATVTATRTPEETVDLRQAIVTQTVAAPLLQNGIQYTLTPQTVSGYFSSVPNVATNTVTRTETPSLADLLAAQLPNGINGLQIFGGNFGSQLTPNYGLRPGTGFGYPGSQIIGLNNLNNIPGLRVQELPYSVLQGNAGLYNLYNSYNNRRREAYRRRGSHRDQYYSDLAGYRQWLRNRYGAQGYAGYPSYSRLQGGGLGYVQQSVSSYSQAGDYDDEEEDDYAEANGDEFVEGDDFGDDYENGDDLWRKANGDTQSKAKSNKGSQKHKQKQKQKKRTESGQQQATQ
ncbi:hypothetical protein KR093_006364, partial [Drosophila rubida]